LINTIPLTDLCVGEKLRIARPLFHFIKIAEGKVVENKAQSAQNATEGHESGEAGGRV
jgi:hypothetical protein